MVYYVITLLEQLLLEIVISMPHISKTEVTDGDFKEFVKNKSIAICEIPTPHTDSECIIVISYNLIKSRMSITVSSDKKLL